MGILFHQETKTFHLYNKEVSYIIRIMENGQLENLYYGKAIRDREDFTHLHEEMSRPLTSVCIPEPGVLNMQCTKQEYPVYGTGDYRSSAFTVKQESGSKVVNFTYVSHEIYHGKKAITPLPAVYTNSDEEACTLELHLHDQMMHTDLVLTYTIFEEYPVITRHAAVCHKGEEPITLEKVMSMSVEFQDMDFEMVQLSGAWARERYVKERKLEMGIQAIQGINGTGCGAEHNPFLALKRPDATEQQGEVYGFSLVYSGNFLAQTEVSTFDMTRVMLGIHPEGFSWKLEKGETFQTPEAVLVYSDKGLNKMSQVYHRLYRRNLMRGNWKEQPRPILLNNWEATYFDFTEEKILDIAAKAKEAGVELFVLDDGWFGKREDDTSGLGDWFVNEKKIKGGLGKLVERINQMGMKFGIWFEPEAVSEDSELYRAHPDWCLAILNRKPNRSRYELILDMARADVREYLFQAMCEVLDSANIEYVKWDMNRNLSDVWSAYFPKDRQGEIYHRYVLGLYELLEKLIQRYPDILFEGCSGGGGRFDAGMLYYTPQIWCSDNTDAIERLSIQYGTSFAYPISTVGSHVSVCPNHQTGRNTPMYTRAVVAMAGSFGYELDVNQLCEKDKEEIRYQIEAYKKYQSLIHDGIYDRLSNPYENHTYTAWQFTSEDKSEVLVNYVLTKKHANEKVYYLYLRNLEEEAFYQDKENGKIYTGAALMYGGLPMPRNIQEYEAVQLYFERLEKSN